MKSNLTLSLEESPLLCLMEKRLHSQRFSEKIDSMAIRILEPLLRKILTNKSVLLLGARQVGKSTLLRKLKPDLIINFAQESTYLEHLKNPDLLQMKIAALDVKIPVILLDEVQRIPSILNTVQALLDESKSIRFLLSGSSARKLSRGKANLLPGRVIFEHLYPLLIEEILTDSKSFDLERALQVGLLPEIYLEDFGESILSSYVEIYLREEIQAEAFVKDMGAYVRFLDLAAEVSGQFINYAKLSSDAEINKDTIRSYFQILEDTLLIHRVPSFGGVEKTRKARQKDKFYFFDLGVRNALLKKTKSHFTDTEKGALFEHLIFQQLKAIRDYKKRDWEIKCYRDDRGLEIDFVLESRDLIHLIEVKYQKKFRPDLEYALTAFEALMKTKKKVQKTILYIGSEKLKTKSNTHVVPYADFLRSI